MVKKVIKAYGCNGQFWGLLKRRLSLFNASVKTVIERVRLGLV